MKYPTAGTGRARTLNVPRLDGGLDLSQAAERIEKNQLSACRNFYYARGALRTRPGMLVKAGTYPENVADDAAFFTTSDERFTIMKTVGSYEIGMFFKIDNEAGRVTALDAAEGVTVPPSNGGFFAQDGGTVLFFAANGQVFRLDPEAGTVATVAESAFTVPLVLIGCKPGELGETSGTIFAGFNALTRRFLSEWTTNGKGSYYSFPVKLDETAGAVVRYTNPNGKEYVFTIEPGKKVSEQQSVDGVSVRFTLLSQHLLCDNENEEDIALPASFTGNLTIEASRAEAAGWKSDIFRFRRSCAFGGSSHGSFGGNRVFITGDAQDGSMVRYSDTDDPLYFPENNFFRVGLRDEPVTAFGKQQSYLVLFKEREIYACSYTAASVDGEGIAEGTTTDASSTAYFPVVMVSSAIGCTLPDTVAVCGNRLTWATQDETDGVRVYMLSSMTAFSARAVRHISHNIDRGLNEKAFTTASAAVFDNAYHLALDEQVWLFDFSDYGFSYNASYASEEKAAKRIAWYHWDVTLPHIYARLGGVCTTRMLPQRWVLTAEKDFYQSIIIPARLTDGVPDSAVNALSDRNGFAVVDVSDRPIEAEFATAQFAPGGFDRVANVPSIVLLAAGDAACTVAYPTDRDMFEHPFPVRVASGERLRPWRLNPRASRVRTVGLRVESRGELAVGDMSMTYTILGGVKG